MTSLMTRRQAMWLVAGFAALPRTEAEREPTLHWDFEGGSLMKAEQTGENRFRCHVKGQRDQDGRNRQASWYFFRVDRAKGRTLTFEMVDLEGEYNYHPTKGAITKNTLPFYSIDDLSWMPVEEAVYDTASLSLAYSLPIPTDRMWIAHVPPYTLTTFANLTRDLARSPYVRIAPIGRSVEKRPIPLMTITDVSVPEKGKKVLWLMFRQHAWEAGSSWTGEGLMRYAVSDDPLARAIRRGAVLKILPMNDPDGVSHGGVRFNDFGFDLNRNWDHILPAKMPEIRCEHAAVSEWLNAGKPIDFFLTLHNDEDNEHLQGPPDERWRPLLERTWNAWSQGRTFAPTEKAKLMDATTTQGMLGRMNVVQALSSERGIAAFEVEMRITKHPKLGRRPNITDRLLSGKELLQAIWTGLSA